jgi:hypothetical protein
VEEEEGVLQLLQFWGNAMCAIVQMEKKDKFEVEQKTSVKALKGPGYELLYVRGTFPSMTKLGRDNETKSPSVRPHFYPNTSRLLLINGTQLRPTSNHCHGRQSSCSMKTYAANVKVF